MIYNENIYDFYYTTKTESIQDFDLRKGKQNRPSRISGMTGSFLFGVGYFFVKFAVMPDA